MSLIVADTTPLSCLLRIGREDLLGALFPDIRIPVAVADELDRGVALVGDWRARLLPPARIEPVEPSPLLQLLTDELDEGEAAALALATQIHADLVLLDELRGRSVAARLGIAVVGTIGLLVTAKKRGLIPAARPLIAQVRTHGGLWVTEKLVAEVLARLGE
jgi:predicted nucleic acid-binding protein